LRRRDQPKGFKQAAKHFFISAPIKERLDIPTARIAGIVAKRGAGPRLGD
jgi:hypothetical protein